MISIVSPVFFSFPIPLPFKFRGLPRSASKKIAVSYLPYVCEDVCLLEYVGSDSPAVLLFMSSDGGHCPNDQPKNCSRTFFSKRSSLATYIVDCMAMGKEQVPSGIPLFKCK